jgi:hypothetical protein
MVRPIGDPAGGRKPGRGLLSTVPSGSSAKAAFARHLGTVATPPKKRAANLKLTPTDHGNSGLILLLMQGLAGSIDPGTGEPQFGVRQAQVGEDISAADNVVRFLIL